MKNRVIPRPRLAATALAMDNSPCVTWYGRNTALVWTRLRRL